VLPGGASVPGDSLVGDGLEWERSVVDRGQFDELELELEFKLNSPLVPTRIDVGW